jgi:HEAT repeat protein
VRRWLDSMPARDEPQHFPPAPALSWDEWAQAGRVIPGIREELAAAVAEAPDEFTRAQAATALGYVGDRAGVAPLTAAVEHDVPAVAAAAATALGQLGDPAAIEPLRTALGHADTNVRASATTALGTFDDDSARAAVDRAATDPDPFVRSAAAAARR